MDEVEALAARHAALEEQLAGRTRERDATRRLLDEARRLPVLDNLRVAAPCSVAWASMPGDERVRACAECQQHVYNLTAMTRDQAEALIRDKNGKLCVRYFQRADGTILLADCAVGVARRRRRRFVIAGAVVSIAGAALYKLVPERPQPVAPVVIDSPPPPRVFAAPPPPPSSPEGAWTVGAAAPPLPPPHPRPHPHHATPRAAHADGDWIMGKK
jgi:hypothetical protein